MPGGYDMGGLCLGVSKRESPLDTHTHRQRYPPKHRPKCTETASGNPPDTCSPYTFQYPPCSPPLDRQTNTFEKITFENFLVGDNKFILPSQKYRINASSPAPHIKKF